MRIQRHVCILVPAVLLSIALLAPPSAGQGGGRFAVVFEEDAFPIGFEGDLLVAFGPVGGLEPRMAIHQFFGAPPTLRFRVDVEAGEELVVGADDAVATYPVDWTEVQPGDWFVQAIARVSKLGRQGGLDEGDVYSVSVEATYDPASEESIELVLEEVAERRPFRETDRVKLFELESELLGEFHGFPYPMRAGVRLPVDHDPKERYPVVWIVTGFGGTHESIHRWSGMIPEESPLEHAILVVPDATNRYGHSVFCDSPSIGPWGEALVSELIPALEAEFGGAGPEHRYVTGVSSGGWSSLWLQVTYPDSFAGCWSHVPDPIDFHDFQRIDLYEPLADGTPRNMYFDEQGELRAVTRMQGLPDPSYRGFVQHECALGPGGQIRSFEGTFSPRSPDGTPRRLFDVETGEIDHEVAAAWRPYDISNTLLTRWDELRGDLAGKIHVYAGEVDTFYLEGAVRRFQSLAGEAGLLDEMVIEVIPGMAHTLHRPGHEDMIATIEARWAER